jgi:uncharacterized circularly permuted ATP-grasp superfamily protein
VGDAAYGAVGAYHALLSNDELSAASLEQLASGQHEHRLYFGEHPLSVSLRPRFISGDDWERATRAGNSIHGALGTLERALLSSAELRAELELAPGEEQLALADPGCRSSSPSSRLDSFAGDEIRYVEYNAESPAGMAYSDVLTEVMEQMEVMRRFRRSWGLRALPSRGRQFDCMLRAFSEWGGSEKPSVAIVDWAGLPTLNEFEMFREYFASRGIPCCICEPRALEYDGRRLHACDGSEVTIVYRRVLSSELLAKEDEASALLRAYLDGAIVMVNTFRAKLLHKKMSLALLSDDAYAALYSASERAAIARHIPWTRRLREGRSSRAGADLDDLAGYVLEHREDLVLKPNDEYGGKGVVLGWTVDDHQWEEVVRVAMHQCYVVQEAVPVPREPFPIAVGDSVEMIDMAVDMNPYLFDGRVGALMTRLSSSALLNVTAGEGSVVPTYVVESVPHGAGGPAPQQPASPGPRT